MFRFSRHYAQNKAAEHASAEAIDRARAAIALEQQKGRQWRRKHPNRDPQALMKAWNDNKLKASKEYAQLIVQFMSTFDGVAEANQMLRFGMEAPNTEIPLDAFTDMATNVFTIRLFEMLATQTDLSQYSRELVLARLVPQVFSPASIKPRRDFGEGVVIPLEENAKSHKRNLR